MSMKNEMKIVLYFDTFFFFIEDWGVGVFISVNTHKRSVNDPIFFIELIIIINQSINQKQQKATELLKIICIASLSFSLCH